MRNAVWDWRRGSKLIAGPSWNGTLPVVNFGIACSPAPAAAKGAQELVVFGGMSMKWWVLTNTLTSRAASFGTDMPPEEVRCAVYLDDGRLLTGHASGIRQWENHVCVRIVLCASGVNSLVALPHANRLVLSGAQDGQVSRWDGSGRHLKPLPSAPTPRGAKQQPQPITSLAAHEEHVFVATSHRCILRVRPGDATPTVLFPGHAAAVQMVACHPTLPQQFATVGGDGNVAIWDGVTHRARGWIRMGRGAAGSCVAFSSDGRHLAVGLADGRLRVFEMTSNHHQASGEEEELDTDAFPLVFCASISKVQRLQKVVANRS
jgi:WD40 repeat protein